MFGVFDDHASILLLITKRLISPQDCKRLVKEVGNALKDTDLTFRFKMKDSSKKPDREEIPFQVGNMLVSVKTLPEEARQRGDSIPGRKYAR